MQFAIVIKATCRFQNVDPLRIYVFVINLISRNRYRTIVKIDTLIAIVRSGISRRIKLFPAESIYIF